MGNIDELRKDLINNYNDFLNKAIANLEYIRENVKDDYNIRTNLSIIIINMRENKPVEEAIKAGMNDVSSGETMRKYEMAVKCALEYYDYALYFKRKALEIS